MASYTHPAVISDLLLYEVHEQWSRDRVVLTGLNGTMGAVLGKITASGKFTDFDPDAVDGSQNATAILLADADASSADKTVPVLARGAVVDSNGLVWGAGVDAGEQTAAKAALLALGIKVVDTV